MPGPDEQHALVAFATLGAFTVAQELAGAVLEITRGAEPPLVIEETLAMTSVATTRAAALEAPGGPVEVALLDLPVLYREYVAGGLVLDGRNIADPDREHERLRKKIAFYAAHLPAGGFPGQRTLADKLPLWIGRVSPPGLSDSPEERLEKTRAVPTLLDHLKIVHAFARTLAADASQTPSAE